MQSYANFLHVFTCFIMFSLVRAVFYAKPEIATALQASQ